MDGSVLWRATLAQAVAVGALFAVLVALPIPISFFREHGALVGPVSWLGCALVVARVLSFRAWEAVSAAAISGALAVLAALATSHTGGMVAGVLAFGGACALLVGHRRRAGGETAQRTTRRLPGGGAAPSSDPSHHAADP
jgi:hypothetical protein